jgi:hypothetical protein
LKESKSETLKKCLSDWLKKVPANKRSSTNATVGASKMRKKGDNPNGELAENAASLSEEETYTSCDDNQDAEVVDLT